MKNPMKQQIKKFLLLVTVALCCFSLISCSVVPLLPENTPASTAQAAPTLAAVTPTVFQPVLPPADTMPVPSPTTAPSLSWINAALPKEVIQAAMQDPTISLTETTETKEAAAFRLDFSNDPAAPAWLYSLVVPFFRVEDELSLDELRRIWADDAPEHGQAEIFVTPQDKPALQVLLGEASPERVKEASADEILRAVYQNPNALAILPFQALQPRWKVLRVDGQNPISNQFNLQAYPLKLHFQWFAAAGADVSHLQLPPTNFDPSKRTVLLMTGVTALVRSTAVQMEAQGILFPARDIMDWLQSADITHISNEAPFDPHCPPPQNYIVPPIFCSDPKYFELLETIGTDVIELSGNHEMDWGYDSFIYSLDLYEEKNLPYFAAGRTLEEARQPVLMEHNGNKLAFLGCNPAGPPAVWASEAFGGVIYCDDNYLQPQIAELKAQGYQVIFTFQHFESYNHWVEDFQKRGFRKMIDYGADIVSGSQAHHPMGFDFYQNGFIHYGLGNLFFDQMAMDWTSIPDGTRKEFLDRYTFYDGKLISVELLTAMLEDYARPRPMTDAERQDFLQTIFEASYWQDTQEQ